MADAPVAVTTGDTAAESAPLNQWLQLVDESTGRFYYVHAATQATTWEAPAHFVPHSDDALPTPPPAVPHNTPPPPRQATLGQLVSTILRPVQSRTPKTTTKATEKGELRDPPHLALHDFAVAHFQLCTRPKLPFQQAKAFDLQQRLQWERDLLDTPLTKLEGDQAKVGIQAFRNISGFMGNRSSGKGQIDHCFKLIRNVMPRAAAIKDEIFCQLCKQLTGNPDINATWNGWLLLHACLVSFPPSDQLAPFMERFFANHLGANDSRIAQFAAGCACALHQWPKKPERKEIPSLREIESLREQTQVEMTIYFIDDSTMKFCVDSWTTCAELADAIASKRGIRKPQAFSLFEVSPNGEGRRLDSDERVLDLFALWERIGVEKVTKKKNSGVSLSTYRLLYKLYLHLPLDDDMIEDLRLVYLQAVHDTINSVVICPLRDCIQLAALQLQCTFGPYQLGRDPVSSDTIQRFIPSTCLSKANRSDVTSQVLEAYKILEDKSIQQSQLTYLRICSAQRLHGSTFFHILNTRSRSMPADLVLTVNSKGIDLVSVVNDATLEHFPFVNIVTWGYSSNSFVFVVVCGNEEKEFVFKTKMGKAINDVVAAYVACILSAASRA